MKHNFKGFLKTSCALALSSAMMISPLTAYIPQAVTVYAASETEADTKTECVNISRYIPSGNAIKEEEVNFEFTPDKVVTDVQITKNTYEDGRELYKAVAEVSKNVMGTDIIEAVKTACGGQNVIFTAVNIKKNGKVLNKFTVNSSQVKSGTAFKVFEIDEETGDLILTSVKDAAISDKNKLKFNGKKGNYLLVEENEAEKIITAIENGVVPEQKYMELNAGEKSVISFSKEFNLLNAAKISYKSDNKKVADVDKNGVIKTGIGGSATIRVKVKLANKTVKEFDMAVRVNG